MARYGFAIGAFAFSREPVEKARRIVDLAARLDERLALLQGHEACEILALVAHKVRPASEDVAALKREQCLPCRKGGLRRIDRLIDIGGLERSDAAYRLPGRRILDLDARGPRDPPSCQESIALHEAGWATSLRQGKGGGAHSQF